MLTYLFPRLLSILFVWEISNEPISTLKSQVALKNAEMAAKMVQVDSLAGRIKIVEGMSLRSATICAHGLQMGSDEVASSSAVAALRSTQSQLQNVCASGSSLREQVGLLQSDNTRLQEQYGFEAQGGGRTRNLLDNASE